MKFLICFLGLFALCYTQETQYFKLCVLPRDYNRCAELSRGGSQVQCVRAQDSVDCALKLANKEADFASFDPEQAHLISAFINTDHVILAEARARQFETRNSSFQTVVVVRNSYNGGFDGLQGKRYCHPGFKYHTLWTPRARKEFENIILKNKLDKSCSLNTTQSYLEHELKTISEYFGDSCRPGPWTDDTKMERELRRQYPNLCKLCDNVNECSYNDAQEDRSLNCLTEKNADVAYTTLDTVLKISNIQDYKLLCPNGEYTNIAREIRPDCAWRNQPWTLIAARRNIAEQLTYSLNIWIDNQYLAVTQTGSPFANRLPWQNVLAEILTQDKAYRLNILKVAPSIKLFLGRNNQNVETTVKDCPMRWCTISQKELQKCEWVAKASLIAGVEPQISCIVGDNIYDCLKKIKDNNADIIAIDSNYGYLARKLGLNNVLYNENSPEDVASIVAVVPPGSSIRKFEDIKKKKACFPEYRGLAWVSFIDQARRRKLIRDNCEFGKSVSDFFDGVCAPGAKDEQHYRQRNEEYPKLCSICSDNCESSTQNDFYDNQGALSCLLKKLADVAFVEVEAVANITNLEDYEVICDDERTVSLRDIASANENCFLSKTVDSEIIARYNDTRKEEYKQALLLMDQLFGTASTSQRSISLFQTFDGVENLMFKDKVLGFDDDSSENTYVRNYIDIFKKIDICTNSSWILSVSILTIAISSLALLFF